MKSSYLFPLVFILAGCGGHAPAPPAAAPSSTPAGSGEGLSDDAIAARLIKAAGEGMPGINDKGEGMLLELARGLGCPCPGESRSLAACIAKRGDACARAPFAARAILRALGRGESPKRVAPRLLERFGPVEPEKIKLSRLPCRGKEDAPATLLVVSDFQCPFCAMGKRLVEELEEQAGDRLRVCFLHWPLTRIHPLALEAARAAVAAQKQGKFWQMHDRLFEHRKELERDDLLDHARELDLDMTRFAADLDSPAVAARVELEIAEARRLRLSGTPSFLINGRRYTDPKTPDDFMDWIAEAEAVAEKQKPKSEAAKTKN